MNAERWQQIKAILEIALEKDTNSIESYLDKACAGDSDLRAEVDSLIAMRKDAKDISQVKPIDIIDDLPIKNIKEPNRNITSKYQIKTVDTQKNIIGRTLGDFLVKEKLGEGGFGAVYKATQLTLEREVVIKILHTRHSTNRSIIERFKREAHLASRLEHPYCAHIYSFGAENDGLLWIAMELVQGTPLNEILKSQGALPLDKFVPLLDKICEVVHTAHEASIIHRDLKPANVMVISRAGRLLPKLLDFGIAKGLSQNSNIPNSLSNITKNNDSPKDLPNDFSSDKARETVTDANKIAKDTDGVKNQETVINDVNNSQQTVIDKNGFKGQETFIDKNGFDGQETVIDSISNNQETVINNDINKFQQTIIDKNGFKGQETVIDNQYKDIGKNQNIVEAGKKTDSNKQLATDPKAVKSITKAETFQTQGFIGSPPYMSPEQWQNGANVDARSDIYSLGILAYQVIMGMLPFKEKGYELYGAHVSKPVPPLKAGFSAELNQVLQKALAKRPEERYQTALEFAKEFREAANVDEEKIKLPHLDEILKENILTNAPKPLADTVASLLASRNMYQFRDRVLLVFRVLTHYIGILVLARYISDSNRQEDNELVNKSIRILCQEDLSESEWIELARELCRPFAKKRDAFAIPELISLFFVPDSEQLSHTNETFSNLLELQEKILSALSLKEEDLVELLAEFLAKLTLLLTATVWLNDYYLVLPKSVQAIKWMGIGKDLGVISIKDNNIASDKVILVDAKGSFVLSLWPLVEITEPMLGVAEEMFLLEGKGRNGAKLVSFPYGFEIESEACLEWLKEHFFTNDEESQAGLSLEKSPYLGLATFSPEDSTLFFGREKETESFLNRLRVQPLVAVVGPSGAGKSSFIQAGVIAGLPKNWKVLTVRPKLSPINTLSAKLSTLGLEVTDLKTELQKDIEFLAKTLRQFAIHNSCVVLLVVDQFEEIFTLCLDKEEQKLYVDAIVLAARSEEDPIRVVLTMRDDFLIRAKELNILKNRLNQSLEILTTPDSAQLLRILILPARRLGYEFEDQELPTEIVKSLAGQTSALPLLAFTAVKLWQQRDKESKLLRRKSYETMGGVGGALGKYAEELLRQMTQAEQYVVREVFRHLVTGEGTRAILTRSELLELLEKNSDSESVIEKLISARLLVATEGEKGIDRIEIVHETLLSTWPRLVKWQQEDMEGARLRDQLRAAARQWDERGRPKGLLWRDDALTELRLWRSHYSVKLTDIEEDFSKASLAEDARNRLRTKLLLGTTITVLVIALVVFYWSNKQTHSRLLESYLEQGCQELLNGKPGKAALYFNEVYKQGKNTPALRLLMAEVVRLIENSTAITLEGHQNRVNAAVFSPDTSKIVSVDDGYTIKVWDSVTGNLLKTIEEHKAEVLGVSFSFDGKYFATSSKDKTLKLWDSNTYELVKTFQGLSAISKSSFSHDSKKIVSSNEDNSLTIWDVDTGQVLEAFKYPFSVNYAVFSPDDKTILMANDDNRARILDWQSKNIVLTLEGHTDRVIMANFSPDGKKIVTASKDNLAKIWEAKDGKLLASLTKHSQALNSAEFNASGTLIVTAGDSSIKIWNALDGLFINSLDGHTSYVLSAFFSSKGDKIVSAGSDHKVKIWDVSKLEPRATTLEDAPGYPTSADFSYDGQQIVSVRDGKKVSIWDVNTKKELASFESNPTFFASCYAKFSPDGTKILTTAARNNKYVVGHPDAMKDSKVVNIWDSKTTKLLFTLKGHDADVWHASFSPDGKRIVTASYDKTAKIWDANNGNLLLTLKGHNEYVNSAEFSLDGKQIVTVSGLERSIIIWDSYTGTIIKTIKPHDLEISYAKFSPDGKRIISCSKDTTVKVWDLVNDKLLFSLEGHLGEVSSCDYSPDGAFIATTSADSTLRIWDAFTGKPLIVIQAHKSLANGIRFSPDSRKLVTISVDGTVKLWDIKLEERNPEEFSKIVEKYVPLRFEEGNFIIISPSKLSQ